MSAWSPCKAMIPDSRKMYAGRMFRCGTHTRRESGLCWRHDPAYVKPATPTELRAENARLLQLLTDEQNAHKLTAETLAKAIRDGDKAEQYRVERDQARTALDRLQAVHSWCGQVDRASGAFDPNDRHEMGG